MDFYNSTVVETFHETSLHFFVSTVNYKTCPRPIVRDCFLCNWKSYSFRQHFVQYGRETAPATQNRCDWILQNV